MTTTTETGGDGWVQHGKLAGSVAVELLASLADAVVVADVEGRITVWNDAAVELFGWTPGDALGRSLDLIIPERWRARHWAGFRRVTATGTSRYGTELLQTPARHRSGRRLSIAFTVTVIRDDERVLGIAAVVRDETDRRAELQRLRAVDEPVDG